MNKKRTKKDNIGDLLPCLYGILLLIENDEKDNKKGYHWGDVKAKVKLSDIIDSERGFATIISDSGRNTLKLKKSGAIAYKLLNEVRNAFAHNRIIYNKEEDTIEMNMSNLHGTITKDSFEEIIGLIKESKVNNQKSKKSK